MTTSATAAWANALNNTLANGVEVAPRGKLTRELQMPVYQLSMRQPVVISALRALNYKFAAAEAHWILTGSNRVDGVAPWNKRMAEFSDDGVTLFGAYGPRIQSQLPYVAAKLREDNFSRQAGLTIWREAPMASKDVPCTVAMWFQVRDGLVDMGVFMRSNDLWLGFPYDVFSFSMVGHQLCCRLNEGRLESAERPYLKPGTLRLCAASSHLYAENLDAAARCLTELQSSIIDVPLTPDEMHLQEGALLAWLRDIRDGDKTNPARWWQA